MADPKIISYIERGLKIENITEGVPINIFEKRGIPIAIKIIQDTTYLKYKPKVEFFQKNSDIVKNIIMKDKNVLTLLASMKKNFFSTESILYGFYDEETFFVYDILTNTNYFPYSDLIKIRDEYNYKTDGLTILKPVFSGYKSKEETISFLSEYNSEKKKKINNLFIMPQYPEVSSPTYFFYDESAPKEVEAKDEEIEIIEEVEELPAVTTTEVTTTEVTTTEVTIDEIKDRTELNIEYLKKISKNYPSTKNGLNTEFSKVYKNIKDYIIDKKVFVTKPEMTALPHLVMLWTYWGTYTNMFIVNRYIEKAIKDDKKASEEFFNYPAAFLSKIFYNVWNDLEKEFIDKLAKVTRDSLTVCLIGKVLKEELDFYTEAYETTYGFCSK